MSAFSSDDQSLYAFQRNVVIAASAGTGKTHRLTALYVVLALGLTSMGQASNEVAHDPIPVSRIVATTFSRAAANEIRSRVEGTLRIIASGAPSRFTDVIADRAASLHLDLERLDLPARAAHALLMWHAARIDTLHGIAGAIVKEHALALGVSPRARVEEEDEGRALIAAAVDETLGSAFARGGESEAMARALVASAGSVVAARDHLATLFARMDEDGSEISELVTTDHLSEAQAIRKELSSIARACALSGAKNSAPLGSALFQALEAETQLAIGAASERALEELFVMRKPKDDKMSSAERELFAFKDRFSAKNNSDRVRILTRLFAEAPELLARERGMLSLLSEARSAIQRERRQRGVLSFGDLLRLARDGMRDHLEVSRLVRADIDVLMVDEFQDTSAVQRDLVYLLREKADARRAAGAQPSAFDVTPFGLFVVGDRKQSIYGFRGADVAVFSRVATELAGVRAATALGLPSTHAASNPSADFFALRDSRRSGPAIVAFVNAFSRLDFQADRAPSANPPEFEISYGEAEHLTSVRDDVDDRVMFLRDDGDAAPPSEPLLASGEPALREAFVAAAFANRACDKLGFAFRDVAILARRRSTIPLVELGLGRLGIPYVVAGRALYEASEVRDVAALIRLILDPRDRHSLATILRGPLVGLSDAALLALTGERGLSRDILGRDPPKLDARAFVEESGRLRDFRERFLGLREPLLRLAPGEALRAALERFDLDRIISALPRAAPRLGNVDRLAGIARERGGTLLGFSRWLDRQIADETDEAEAAVFSADDDAVRLTTIHASKGLDFRVVVLLDLDSAARSVPPPIGYHRDAEGRPRFIVTHKGERGVSIPSRAASDAQENRKARELAERKRITYVATTRAQELLVLVGRPGTAKTASANATLMVGRESGAFPHLVEESAADILNEAFSDEGRMKARALGMTDEERSVLRAVPRNPWPIPVRRLPIATTPLGVFRGCARRFRLRFLLGLEEPVESGQLDLFEAMPQRVDERVESMTQDEGDLDPRVLGRAAHRVLELWPASAWGTTIDLNEVIDALSREGLESEEATRLAPNLVRILGGAFARGAASSGNRIHREKELIWESGGQPGLALRGTLDLFVERSDGGIDVVDYKLSRPQRDIERYAFQLRSYALALSRNHPGARVRAGILFLEGGEDPVWLSGGESDGSLSETEHEAFANELNELGQRFADARTKAEYPPIALEGCRALHCGFITACHKPEARRDGRRGGRQGARR